MRRIRIRRGTKPTSICQRGGSTSSSVEAKVPWWWADENMVEVTLDVRNASLLSARQTPRRRSRLFCRYFNNQRHPNYLIGPVKQEDEWDSPYIVRFHDIASEKEMEMVKELAKPRVSPTADHSWDFTVCVLTQSRNSINPFRVFKKQTYLGVNVWHSVRLAVGIQRLCGTTQVHMVLHSTTHFDITLHTFTLCSFLHTTHDNITLYTLT